MFFFYEICLASSKSWVFLVSIEQFFLQLVSKSCYKEAPYSFQLYALDHVFLVSYVTFVLVSAAFFSRENTFLGRFLLSFSGNVSSNFYHIFYLWKTFHLSIIKEKKN